MAEPIWTKWDSFESSRGAIDRIMAETSGSGDITGNVLLGRPFSNSHAFSRRWLNRFGQLWTRLKAAMCP